jgi:hypothetical protein
MNKINNHEIENIDSKEHERFITFDYMKSFIDECVSILIKKQKSENNITEEWFYSNIYSLINKWEEYFEKENINRYFAKYISDEERQKLIEQCRDYILHDPDNFIVELFPNFEEMNTLTLIRKFIMIYIREQTLENNYYHYYFQV